MVNAGSGGRYMITPRPFAPFVMVPASVVSAPPPAAAPVAAAVTPPIATSAAATGPVKAQAAKVRIGSRSLTVRNGRVAVSVSCPPAAKAACRGSIRVRTAAATAVRKGVRKRLVTLTKSLSYTVPARRTRTLSLALSSDARTLLRRMTRVASRIVLTPSTGLAVSVPTTCGARSRPSAVPATGRGYPAAARGRPPPSSPARSVVNPAVRCLLLCALLAGGAVSPAAAPAAVTTANTRKYSYDDLWRPLPITLGGQSSPASARAGDDVKLSSQTFAVDLPSWLAETGYQFGLLTAGDNELEVSVWVALRGANTVQGTRWERLDGTAATTIETDGSGAFVSATPITYSVTPPAPTSWRAKGGRVEFAQAPAGSLPAIPVGPAGAPRTPEGSIFILARLGDTLQLGFDSLRGSATPTAAATCPRWRRR